MASASYSNAVAASLLDYFNEYGFSFDFDKDNGILTTTFPTRSKIGTLDFRIRFLSNGYVSYATARIRADEDSRAKAAEYLSYANYALPFGNFEFNFLDGEIRFKVSCRSGDAALNEDQLTDAFLLSVTQFEIYGDDLLAVLFGFKEPKQAVKDAEVIFRDALNNQ